MAWMPWRIKHTIYPIAIAFAILFCTPIQAVDSPTAREATLQKKALEREAAEKKALKLSAVDQLQKIRVDHFDLIDFKEFTALNWTRHTVDQFLQEQILQHDSLFTIAELDRIARKLSIQMKQAGLMFSRVDLLEQEIKNERVELTFQDGLLGEVVVLDAKRTHPELLARPFLSHLRTTAVRHTLDNALYSLDKLSGVDVFGFFSLTERPGVSRLNLRVVDETTWSGMIHTDNFGNESVGRERVHGTLNILNVTGWGDTLKLNIGRSYSQPGFFEGFAQYTVPVGVQYQPLQFLISNSEFNLGQGFESLEVYGQSTLANINYRHSIPLGQSSLTYRVGASYTLSKVDSLFSSAAFFRKANIKVLDFGVRYSSLLSSRLSQNFNLAAHLGRADEISDVEGGVGGKLREKIVTDFSLLDAHYRLEYFHKNASKGQTTVASFQLFGSPDVLPSVEQRGFGGRHGIKGLPSGYFSADTGFIVNMAHDLLVWPAAWPGQLQLTTDIGIGEKNDIVHLNSNREQQTQTAQFGSVGMRYSWEKRGFHFTYEFGKIIHANLENDAADQAALDAFSRYKPSRHYLSLSYDLGEHK